MYVFLDLGIFFLLGGKIHNQSTLHFPIAGKSCFFAQPYHCGGGGKRRLSQLVGIVFQHFFRMAQDEADDAALSAACPGFVFPESYQYIFS